MTRQRIRDRHHHQRPATAPAVEPRRRFALLRREGVIIAVTVVLAGGMFALGKYIEFNSPGAYDAGAYVYSAAHVLNGAKLGVDEFPSAQPGTFMVNLLGVWLFGYSDTGPKLVQMLMQLGALVLMLLAMRKAFGLIPACIGVFLAATYLSSPLIAKFGNVKEQFMIACMIAGVSLIVFHEYSGKWFYAVLAGAVLVWAPLFKQTGLSAVMATGLFVLAQPILRHKTIGQTARYVGLLLAGAAVSVAPMYVWILGWGIQWGLPYRWVYDILAALWPSAGATEDAAATSYVTEGRRLVPLSVQIPRVLRYYGLFILPITLAVGGIVMRIGLWLRDRKAQTPSPRPVRDRLVLLLGLWWILDMAFVWISPRSYEEYYLPLNGSAAVLAGYILSLYFDKLAATDRLMKWRGIGAAAVLAAILMSWHIYFGISRSPFSATSYGGRRNGFVQRVKEIRDLKKRGGYYSWQAAAHYVRDHSTPQDTMYVWGWYPGMYVAAGRFSSASRCCSMTRNAPAILADEVRTLLAEFEKRPPKFIIDSRKRHIPIERPPYELWPKMPKGFMGAQEASFLPNNTSIVEAFDKAWAGMLEQQFDKAEAQRYEILKPLRQYVMQNYRVVREFGEHVLFEKK